MTTTPDAAAPVVRAAYVQRPQTETFAIFTDQIGAWWPLPTHGVFGEQAGGLEFRDGRLIELAVDGRESTWGEVRAWEPPSRMVISWHPGRDTGEQSEVEVRFEPDAAGTRVIIEHRGWETFGADAMRRRRGYVGPSAWGYVLDHFADVAEPRDQAPDLGGLAAAYDAFFAEAERGGFGPPPADSEWDADQTLAHVALSDLTTIAVSQAIIHQEPARFANVDCQTPDHLAAWIVRCGNTTGLIAEGRAVAQQVMAVLARLSPQQLAQAVPCYLLHDGQVLVDEPRPWGTIAIHGQAGMHLPAHTGQLSNLRPMT
ncbi:SRPBCC domain-containing protein [Nostocoides australiense]|uniref:Activator of Hsp90 ATPase homologue 1/2-like C-terminal domain-containing protein n=1 Tax=Nostocoides australiense Ben110 TaxID=1193182 RepID=W6JXA7_9MICO|nr:SRPBCC domain-containing protein [Tetrasphaera australiensis]MCA0290246.1 SRPBCC domain-containing protein [Actinomycetota bacterium]MCB1302024.1 SRPBCC domain-containing protein [Tetrasphaera sp.]CCH73270.1 hypothetical protein BN11_250013 [Tetrasphaera australiensis Ben110]